MPFKVISPYRYSRLPDISYLIAEGLAYHGTFHVDRAEFELEA